MDWCGSTTIATGQGLGLQQRQPKHLFTWVFNQGIDEWAKLLLILNRLIQPALVERAESLFVGGGFVLGSSTCGLAMALISGEICDGDKYFGFRRNPPPLGFYTARPARRLLEGISEFKPAGSTW